VKRYPRAITYGLIAIVAIQIVASLILSLLLRFTPLTEQSLQWVIVAISFIALFVGGVIAGGKGKESGWILGGVTGLLYTIIIFLIQFLGFDSSFDANQLLTHALYLLTAMLGGMIGVNLGGKKK